MFSNQRQVRFTLVLLSGLMMLATTAIGSDAEYHATSHAELTTSGGDSNALSTTKGNVQAATGSGILEPVRAPDREAERSLLRWATHLSGYEPDTPLPLVRYVPRSFLAERACSGRDECKVLGWYDDRNVVYIAEELVALESLFARSLLVHEFVHYLQHRSGRFAEHECAVFVEREREAYAVQQKFFIAYGAFPQMRTHQYSCHEIDIIPRKGQAIAAPLAMGAD